MDTNILDIVLFEQHGQAFGEQLPEHEEVMVTLMYKHCDKLNRYK